MDSKFKKPDQETIKRMTVISLQALLSTLEGKRAAVVKPLDEEIAFYKKVYEDKLSENKTSLIEKGDNATASR